MVKFILGLQSYANHDSGACIIKFGKNIKPEIIAISEERLIRKKYPYTFPVHSILYCMRHFKIKKFNRIDLIVSDWIRKKKWLRSGPSYNYQEFDYIKENLNFDKKKIIQINHHLAHASSTFYSSNFKSSAILIVDGNGSDVETNSYYVGEGNKINFLKSYKCHGIGAAYGAVTKQVLSLGTGGEGKTMGLAPYGKFNNKIKINFKNRDIETSFKDFMLRMPNSDVLNHVHPNYRPNTIRQKIVKANKKNVMNKKYSDWAFMIQNVAEKTMIHLGKKIFSCSKKKNICLAGGVALNSVANEKLMRNSKFKDIFIFPACADSGIPYGLALWAYYNFFKQKKKIEFKNAYTGIKYSDHDIKNTLNKVGLNYSIIGDFEIASLISKGKIIAFFNEGSEYGPRALGNRSILADPRRKEIRDFINKNIKHREMFRPFAPAILEEKSNEYFGIKYSPYMLRVAKCKKKRLIPSALHVDNTARLQTVNKKQNKKFYSIIKNFFNLTKVPVLLNTSFNDAGEPLVETPLDAIISSLKTGVDYLVLNKFSINIKLLSVVNKKKLLRKTLKLRNRLIKDNNKIGLKILTKKYSKTILKKRIKKENNNAIFNVLYRPVIKIKKYLNELSSNKKIIFIGSNDHTNILIKIFKKELSKFKNKEFFEIKNNDIYKRKRKIIFLKKINKIKYGKGYIYFISSFQYSNELKFMLKTKGLEVFCPYDNSSRSIIDYDYIKKYGNKYKMYEKKL